MAKGHVEEQRCAFLKGGYESFSGDWTSFPEYPIQNVPEVVQKKIQTCWSNSPYRGRASGIVLVEARRISPDSYYVAFEPNGYTDVLLVFRVKGDEIESADSLGLL